MSAFTTTARSASVASSKIQTSADSRTVHCVSCRQYYIVHVTICDGHAEKEEITCPRCNNEITSMRCDMSAPVLIGPFDTIRDAENYF